MESIDAMNLGAFARNKFHCLTLLVAICSLGAVSPAAIAQTAAQADAVAENVADATLDPAVAAQGSAEVTVAADEAGGFEHYGPDMILGQPTDGAYGFQEQYTEDGNYALWMHDALLMPIITVISLFVLALLLWVVVRFRRSVNPVASKTSHNTLIEVLWTALPVLILVVIAVPSITLIARQYQSPPEDAITIKATGYQWYWGYTYVDNGGFEVISNMLDENEALASGEPHQLAVDNRMVVPVGVPLRIQVNGADVIHSFGIPSLWFKIDAVPGRINERMLTITQPGIYYGQCMELCGARHGYMPIAIEARPMDEYLAWVRTQPGGMVAGDEPAAEAAPTITDQEPESAVEDAPGAGADPVETAPVA